MLVVLDIQAHTNATSSATPLAPLPPALLTWRPRVGGWGARAIALLPPIWGRTAAPSVAYVFVIPANGCVSKIHLCIATHVCMICKTALMSTLWVTPMVMVM